MQCGVESFQNWYAELDIFTYMIVRICTESAVYRVHGIIIQFLQCFYGICMSFRGKL